MEIPKFLLGLIIAFLGSSGIISCLMWCKEEKRANFFERNYTIKKMENEGLQREINRLKSKNAFERILKDERNKK